MNNKLIRSEPEYQDAMAKAYSSKTSIKDKRLLLEQLVEFRNACGERHLWNNRTEKVISDLLSEINNHKPWYKGLLGPLIIALVATVIGGGLLFWLGWN